MFISNFFFEGHEFISILYRHVPPSTNKVEYYYYYYYYYQHVRQACALLDARFYAHDNIKGTF